MKKPWLSKTLIVNFLMAGAALAGFPVVGEWVGAHPDLVIGLFSAVNFALRLVTKDKVGLSE